MKRNKILITVMCCFLFAVSLFAMNQAEAQAAGNYTLQVNKATNVVTVFRSDGTPERAFVCSVGSATPIGTFIRPTNTDGMNWTVLLTDSTAPVLLPGICSIPSGITGMGIMHPSPMYSIISWGQPLPTAVSVLPWQMQNGFMTTVLWEQKLQ